MGGAFFLPGMVNVFLPHSTKSKTMGVPQPFRRSTEPTICPDGVPALPASALDIRASATFPGHTGYDVLVKTDQFGTAQLPLLPAKQAAGYCKAGVLFLSVPADSLAANKHLAPEPLKLEFTAASPVVPIAELAKLNTKASAAAMSCCKADLRLTTFDGCEETCVRAGGVERCLFARRACLMKVERAGDDKDKGATLCQRLYEECFVGNGTSLRNISACSDACITRNVESTCR
jgi:hypothetical protein